MQIRMIVMLAILWTSAGHAGPNVWTRLGPPSAAVAALAIDPKNSATVYAATDVGLLRSQDAGTTWSALMPGPSCCLATLTIHPQDTRILYAVTRPNGRILKSTDSGFNWSPAISGIPADDAGNYGVNSLAIDPKNPNTLYAGSSLKGGGGVFTTNNGGDSWVQVNAGLPDGGVMAVAVDPQTPGTVYASTVKGGLRKTDDGGTGWGSSNDGLTRDIIFGYDYISVLAISSQDPNTLYAARHDAGCEDCGSALFKSSDGGANWTATVRGLGFGGVLSLAIDPHDAHIVWAGTSAGLYKSTDAGASWSATRARQTGDANGRVVIPALAIDPQNPDTVYAADTYSGVLQSTDGGANWAAVNPDLRSAAPADLLALRIDQHDPATLYAGTDAGVFKTTDTGANWVAVNAGLPSGLFGHLPISILTLDPQNPGALYVLDSCCSEPFRSTDGGAGWVPTMARDSSGLVVRGARLWANDLAIDPRNPNTLYAAGSYSQSGGDGSGTGVIKSTDGGTSWRLMNSGLPSSSNAAVVFTSLAIDPQNSGTVYAGSWSQTPYPQGTGVFKSTNGGGGWSNAGLGGYTGVDVLAVDPKNSGTVYARAQFFSPFSLASRLFKTTNAGASWTEVDTGLAGRVNALVIDPLNSSTLYAGTAAGVFRSTNGGASWTALNDGLTSLSVTALAIDPKNPGTVYAGNADGVFVITP